MLDTIKLTLDKTMFAVMDKSKFTRDIQNASRGYFSLVQNPTKGELQRGIYKPRLTLANRFNCSRRFEETLVIELSLPKLLFGNNFDELEPKDFDAVTERLVMRLKEMGVKVWDHCINDFPVSAIHYSKNILLTNGLTSHYVIGKIMEANVNLSLDINQTDYRNGGYSYKWHTNSYEVAFYDKIHDLKASKVSEKRSEERDNALQLNLFDSLQELSGSEVLRMEVRLNLRQKIGQLLKSLGINKDLTYKNLFSREISQKVLIHYLEIMEKQRPPLLDIRATGPKAVLADLAVNNPKLTPRRAFQVFGLQQALSTAPVREIKAMFSKYGGRSWYKLLAETKKINLTRRPNPFSDIRKCLLEFRPLKLVDI